MITVYGRKSSANVQKVRWICSEGNLEFKTEIVGGKYGGLTSPEFMRLNPNSTIPVLKHRCVVLGLDISEFKLLEKLYVNLKERSAFRMEVFSAPLPPE